MENILLPEFKTCHFSVATECGVGAESPNTALSSKAEIVEKENQNYLFRAWG